MFSKIIKNKDIFMKLITLLQEKDKEDIRLMGGLALFR